MINLDIIIPIYNEGKNLERILYKLSKNVKANCFFYICYDKKDESGLKYINKKNKRIILIKNPKQGPNHAIIAGINSGKSENILIYMADDFHNINLINKMLILSSRYDLIVPSRYIKGGKFQNAKFFKKLITDFSSFFINKFLRIPVKDNTNAFKFFKRSILKKIKLKSKVGFTFAIELVVKSYFAGYKIKELPCIWKDLSGRKSNFKVIKWLPHYSYWIYFIILQYIKCFFSLKNK